MEFAIVVPALLLLVFGVIEFGIAYNDYLSVRSGTREAARLGVVNDLDGAPACKIDGVTVTPPTAPTESVGATQALICKTKDQIGLDETKTKITIAVTGPAVGENLKVCASFPLEAITGIAAPFISDKTLVSAVTMRLEQVPEFAEYAEEGASC